MAIEGQEEVVEQDTLRDDLTAAYEAAEAGTLNAPPDAPPIEVAEPEIAPAGETAEQKAGRLAGRARDEHGRLLPGKAEKPAQTPATSPAEAAAPTIPTQGVEAPQAPVAQPQRPSGMKKEHWASFDKLSTENPAFAKYLIQRDQDYATGVSTYKQEWESAKPLLDAVAPFMPELQKHGVNPGQWIQSLGTAHSRLVNSSPQDKMAIFQKLAQDYQIPAQLAVQDANGQWQLLGTLPQPQYQPPQQQPQDIHKIVQETLQKERTAAEVQQFLTNSAEFPYAEQVRDTVAGLLQAGLAESLKDAYDQALHLPKHADLLQAQRDAQQAKEEAAKRQAEAQRVAQARAKVASPRTSTPSAASLAPGKKGLREELSEQYDAHVSGRV